MAFDPSTARMIDDEKNKKKFSFDPTTAVLDEPAQMSQRDLFKQELEKPEPQQITQRDLFSQETGMPVSPAPFISRKLDPLVFPSLSQKSRLPGDNPSLGESAKGAVKMGLDLLSLPVRALGTLRPNPETGENYKLSDNASAVFRPEINKVKGAISEATQFNNNDNYPMRLAKGGAEALGRGVTEIAGNIASDPTFLAGLASKALAKPLKSLGVNIEQTVLGKGNKSLLKKNNLTNEQVAETALESGVGGSLKGTISKIDDKFEIVESQIDDVINKAQQKNPNLTLNPDLAVNKVLSRIANGEPMFFGQTEEAVKALRNLNDELLLYKLNGPQSISKYQEIKRLIGKKGFKKGSVPTADTQAKEQIFDLVNLEMKDELEKVVPEIGELNKVYKQLIPIKQMAESRLPTAQSNDMLGLGNILTTGGGALLGVGAQGLTPEALLYGLGANVLYRASKSGNVAQGLYNLGKLSGKAPVQAVPGLAASANNFSLNEDLGKRKFGR